MNVTLYRGEALDALRALPDASVDAVVTDPPYGLADHKPAALVDALTAWASGDRERVPDGRGFMGKDWDRFVPPPAVWDECLRVLRPGGHLVAFAGSRTYDLMGLSIRMAGFEVRDGFAWLYGSGFPKSLDVSKAIDKARDDRDEIVRVTGWLADQRDRAGWTNRRIDEACGTAGMAGHWTSVKSQPAVPKWEQWLQLRDLIGFGDDMDAEVRRLNGRKGTPGHERADRVVRDREAGAIYQPVQHVDHPGTPVLADAQRWQGWGTALKPGHEPIVLARKPLGGTVAATVLAHGTGALNIDATRVGEGPRPADDVPRGRRPRGMGEVGERRGDPIPNGPTYAAGEGGRWPANVLLGHDPACDEQCAPGCPVAELDAQSGTSTSNLRTPTGGAMFGHRASGSMDGGTIADTTTRGTVDSGGASRFFPTFRYQAKAPTRERPKVDGVAHPTVKPVALMRWLVRLLTPPGGVVLDPFAGSGTTGQAALEEGFAAVLVEREPTYWPLIRHRIGDDLVEVEAPAPAPVDAPVPVELVAAPVVDAGELRDVVEVVIERGVDPLLAAIAAAVDEDACGELYDAHAATWADEHTAAVVARLAELEERAA